MLEFRVMRAGIIFLCLFCAWGGDSESESSRAWHRQNWATWALKTGLKAEAVGRMWTAAMGAGAEERTGEGIETVDATSLGKRGHVLFVTAGGSGHCLGVHVYGLRGKDVEQVWEVGELPEGGGGLCREYLLPYPTAYGTPGGEIVVQVPTGAAWLGQGPNAYPVSTALKVYRYQWDGKTYRLAKTERVVTYESESLNPAKCPQERPCR